MKLLYLFLYISTLCLPALSAQTISRDVVGSAGDHFSAVNGQLEWTLGEVSIETFNSGTSQITQGFHQTNLIISSLGEEGERSEIQVYPNPVTSVLHIKLPAGDQPLNIALYDSQGKLLHESTLLEGREVQQFSMNGYASGIYLLQVRTLLTDEISNYKIYKIR